MRWLKRVFALFLVILVGAQFFRPARNLSPSPGKGDLLVHHPAPPAVKHLLETACYDCHSNNTRYPWYAHVQPFGGWLAGHVRDGKAELNFSEFAAYSTRRATRRLNAAIDQITDREMPLKSYRLTHADARLSEKQIAELTIWFEDVITALEERAEAPSAP